MAKRRAHSEFRMSVLELEQREDEQLRLADIAVRKTYATRVMQALERLKFKKRSVQLAEELLTGDKRLEDILMSKEGQWEQQIENACKEYQGLRDITFLLIGAPRSYTCLSIEQDRQAREKQLMNFYNIITHDREQSKCVKTMTSVQTYPILKQNLQAFMTEDAARSKRAYVVFNGHGKDSGHLSLEKEVSEISNTQFIKDIHETWKECKQSHEMEDGVMILPERISVILAHCYGYKHKVDQEATKVIDVVCLTNPSNPQTKFVYNMNTSDTVVTDALHIELTNYARDVVKQESSESDTSSGVGSLWSSSTDSESSVPTTPMSSGNSVDEDTDDSGAAQEAILPILDVTTLACLAFNSDTTKPARLHQTLCRKDSVVAQLFPGITNLNISVSPKRLSDYCKPTSMDKSVKNMMLTSASFSLAVGAGDQPLTSEPGSSEPAATPAKQSDREDTQSVPAATKSSHKHKLAFLKFKKPKAAPKVGICAAMVGLSASLGQIVQHIDTDQQAPDFGDTSTPEYQC